MNPLIFFATDTQIFTDLICENLCICVSVAFLSITAYGISGKPILPKSYIVVPKKLHYETATYYIHPPDQFINQCSN